MADILPLGTPGRIDAIPETDRVAVGGIVRTIAGQLTFQDSVSGLKTLADLSGGGVGGSTGAVDNALLRANGTGGSTLQAGATGAALLDDGTIVAPLALFGSGAVAGAAPIVIAGAVNISGTAAAAGQKGLTIDARAAGFSDVSGLQVSFATGVTATTQTQAAVVVSIDDTQSAGGACTALAVTSTGTQTSVGLLTGAGVAPVAQYSGVLGNATSILVVAVNQTVALSTGGGGNINVFVANGGTVTIGKASKFSSISFTLDIFAGSTGIIPTFEYSTGVGTWATLGATDGTNGMRTSGSVTWDDTIIPGWVVGTGAEFLIRITRTNAATPAGNARADLVQVASTETFYWRKTGDTRFNSTEMKPVAANPGTAPTSTLWISSADNRVRQGSSILANYVDVAPLQPTGLFTGGLITINANPALFNISAGTGQYVNNTAYPPAVTPVSWSAFTAVTVTNLATDQLTNIGINSAGAIVQQAGPFTLLQQRDIIVLGRLSHTNFTIINNVNTTAQVAFSMEAELQGFFNIFGAILLSGNVWSHNGANLQLTKTAGTSWYYGANYTTSRILPSVTTDPSAGPATWKYVYRDPASPSGFTAGADTTVVTPNSWDDGTGVLATVPNNNWTVQWIYLVPDGILPTYRIGLGQTLYSTSTAAKAGITADTFLTSPGASIAVLCGRLIVQQGTTVLNGAGAIFLAAGKFGGQAAGGGGGGSNGTITGTAGVIANRVIIGSDTTGNVIKASLAVNIPASEVIETAAGLGLPAIAANLGTDPTTTLWNSSADSRFRQGTNILAYLGEAGGTVTITPAAISTQQDNYSPASSSTADIIRMATTGADVAVTGFLATTTTPNKEVWNVGAAGSLVLKNDVTSTAANRFLTPNARDLSIPPGSGALLAYDTTTSRWRVLFSSQRFGEMTDAPSTMASGRGMVPAVNAGETALAYVGIPSTYEVNVPTNAYAAPIAPGKTLTIPRWTPTTCRLRALVAPTVSTLTVTVKINGSTTIGTFTLTAAATTSTAAFSSLTTRVAGDIITVELTGTDTGWSGLIVEANGLSLLA